MFEYALIMLNMLEYIYINLNKQSFEFARILNLSDAVYSITKSLYKLFGSYKDRSIQNTVKHLRWSILQKKKMSECRHSTRNFSGQGTWQQPPPPPKKKKKKIRRGPKNFRPKEYWGGGPEQKIKFVGQLNFRGAYEYSWYKEGHYTSPVLDQPPPFSIPPSFNKSKMSSPFIGLSGKQKY